MTDNNITRLIQLIHGESRDKRLVDEVLKETENTITQLVLDEVDTLIQSAKNDKPNILSFPEHKIIPFAQTTLLAAAGQSIGNWFDHPLSFPAAGMVVDIRRVLGSEDEVDLYIFPNEQNTLIIQQSLLPFRNQNLHIKMTIDGKEYLKAEVYVDESALSAEGQGILLCTDNEGLSGSIEFEVVVE